MSQIGPLFTRRTGGVVLSEEIALAAADRATVAELRAALEAERAKRRSIERAVRAWADMSKHPPMDCEECEDLYAIAQGTHADPDADLSRQIGELNTTVGYQDAMLAQVRAALRPFAVWARLALDQAAARGDTLRASQIVFRLDDVTITVGDLRRATNARSE